MSATTKYITYRDRGEETIIVFEAVKHNVMAAIHRLDRSEVLGAGYISFQCESLPYGKFQVRAVCSGAAESLKYDDVVVVSRGDADSDVANKALL